MKFLILKFLIGFFGFLFLIIFFFSTFELFKIIYFSDANIVDKLFSDFETCESNLNNNNEELCTDIITVYWMIVISITSSILSFINLFPFFIIKKK